MLICILPEIYTICIWIILVNEEHILSKDGGNFSVKCFKLCNVSTEEASCDVPSVVNVGGSVSGSDEASSGSGRHMYSRAGLARHDRVLRRPTRFLSFQLVALILTSRTLL